MAILTRTGPRGTPAPANGFQLFMALPIQLLFISLIILQILVPACSSPTGPPLDTLVVQPPGADDPRFDTLVASVETTIRFDAVIDTNSFPIERFTGTGLSIAIVCMPPYDTSGLPYLDIYSVSANYLDLPAIGLRFRAQIPPGYFRRYLAVRIATAAVLLYKDGNDDGRYNEGEAVYGASEQSLYAFAEGKLENIPPQPYGDLRHGSNVMIRFGQEMYPQFKPAPDFNVTIFMIIARGKDAAYNIPYAWKVPAPLPLNRSKEMRTGARR